MERNLQLITPRQMLSFNFNIIIIVNRPINFNFNASIIYMNGTQITSRSVSCFTCTNSSKNHSIDIVFFFILYLLILFDWSQRPISIVCNIIITDFYVCSFESYLLNLLNTWKEYSRMRNYAKCGGGCASQDWWRRWRWSWTCECFLFSYFMIENRILQDFYGLADLYMDCISYRFTLNEWNSDMGLNRTGF